MKLYRFRGKDLYARVEALAERLQGAGLVVHLAGAPIIGRWTKKYRKEIYDSRIVTTRNIVKAMDLMSAKPDTFICASAVGIYPTGGDFTEENKAVAENFLGKVCADWEAEAEKAPKGVRVLNFRFGDRAGQRGRGAAQADTTLQVFCGWSPGLRQADHVVDSSGGCAGHFQICYREYPTFRTGQHLLPEPGFK
jgi:NAD dependent epimerase/dehydratase family enzyme